MTTFRIASFVNDEAQYGEMRTGFEAAGFTPPLAHFTIEQGEPYAGVSRLGEAVEPYVLLVHQDVRCEWADTATSLEERLAELTAADPHWAVAGNAGRSPRPGEGTARRLTPIRHISDPHGTTWSSGLPKKVVSLDENLLILRTERRPACSPKLSGWHLYGADVALNAVLTGDSAYVIDFRVTHLSGGNPHGYRECSQRFVERWRGESQARNDDDLDSLIAIDSVLAALAHSERGKDRLPG